MATSKQEVVSLLTEHFRYTPLTFVDDVINTVNELVYRAVTAVEEGLTAAPPAALGFTGPQTPDADGYTPARIEIETGVHRLETLLEASVDRNFDKFEIYVLRNILAVPHDLAPWLRLAHYRGLDLAPSSPRVQPEELVAKRRKLAATARLNRALKAERDRNAATLTQLRALLEPGAGLAFLLQPGAKDAKHPLSDNARDALQHVPALKASLAKLREAQRAGVLGRAPRDGEARQERDAYLDEATRGAVAGVGEARVVGARAPGAGAVAAIEGVAGRYGGAGRMEEG